MLDSLRNRVPKTPAVRHSKPVNAPSSNEGTTILLTYHGIAAPNHVAESGSLDYLVDTARDHARQATAESTNKKYTKDRAHFTNWCRRKGANLSRSRIGTMAAPWPDRR